MAGIEESNGLFIKYLLLYYYYIHTYGSNKLFWKCQGVSIFRDPFLYIKHMAI